MTTTTTNSNETKIDSLIDDSLRILIVSGGLFLDGALSRFPGSAVEVALRQRFAHLVHIDIEIDNHLPEILDSFRPDVVFPVNLGESNFVLLRSFIKDSFPCVGSDHYQDSENDCPGRQFFVAVLEVPFLRALPPIAEPFDESGMHTMYMGSEPYICPAVLPSNTTLEVQLAAVEAHLKNGCMDYSRTELRVTEAGVVAVGTDTNPFLTPSSLFCTAALAEGISFTDLCWLLVRHAASRAFSTVDIGFNALYPGNMLSNFADHNFIFDGVPCTSVEGLIQALKFEDCEQQILVCGMAGKQAKMRGSDRNNTWQATQTLWWKGFLMERSSAEYQEFLDRIFFALFDQCDEFKRALAKTGRRILTHSIGKHDPSKTVLTAHELVSRLTFLRKYLLQDKLP